MSEYGNSNYGNGNNIHNPYSNNTHQSSIPPIVDPQIHQPPQVQPETTVKVKKGNMGKKLTIYTVAGLFIFGLGFFGGYEYKAYEIREAFQEAFSITDDTAKASEGTSYIEEVDEETVEPQVVETENEEVVEEDSTETMYFEIGEVATYSTIKVRVNSVEVTNSLPALSQWSDGFIAQEGTKIVIVDYTVENITTKEKFHEPLKFVDSLERTYSASLDASQALDEYIFYDDLLPNIPLTGKTAYVVPEDVTEGWIGAGVSETEIINLQKVL